MALTVKDIAKLAGVSRGTVDRALNNRSGINPEVAQRIRQIAAEHGYVPNTAGKALAAKANPISVGVVINSRGNPFFDEVFRGIEKAKEELSDLALNLIVVEDKGYDPQRQAQSIMELAKQGVRGLAVTPINDNQIAACLNNINIPVVTLNQDIEHVNKVCFIGCDYENSGKTAGQLMGLICAGETDVGIITGSVKMQGHNKRIHGFSRVIETSFPNLHIVDIVENNDDDDESYAVTTTLLQEHPKLGALYLTAAGVEGAIKAVREQNFSGRIICFDDTEQIRSFVSEGLIHATICQHPFEQGYRAIRILFDVIMGRGQPEEKVIYTHSEIKIKENIHN